MDLSQYLVVKNHQSLISHPGCNNKLVEFEVEKNSLELI